MKARLRKGVRALKNSQICFVRPQPIKKSSLKKVTCADCGKVFWSDRETEYCFDCEAKRKK